MQNILKKRNSLIWGVAALLIGILIIFNPINAIEFSVIVLGFILLAVGLIQLISFGATRKRLNLSWASIPLGGVLALVLGIMLVVSPATFILFFMILLAIIIILLAVTQIYSLAMMRKKGATVGAEFFVFPVLLLISGIVVCSFPLETNAWIVIFAGAWIAAYGVSEIFAHFAIKVPEKTEDQKPE